MNFQDLLIKLFEDRSNKEAFTRTGEATKKDKEKAKATDNRSKDAARKRAERAKQTPRERKPKQELVKEVVAVKTASGSVQLIFKDSFSKEQHSKLSKDTLTLPEAQQITKDPKFEQTRASKLLFGDLKSKTTDKKERKGKEEEKSEKKKSAGEEGKKEDKEEEKKAPKAKRLSKEEIFNALSQMGPEQLMQVPADMRQEYFQSTRNPPPNNEYDDLTYENLSVKFSLNPVSSAPYNQQVLNALIFLAKLKMGASDQEMQTISAMNPAGMDFTRGAFYTAKKILSQMGEQCIQNLMTTIESGGKPINSDGVPDMACGDFRFKVSAGGEISLSTSEFNQSNKAFKGYLGSAMMTALNNINSFTQDKNIQGLLQNSGQIKSNYSSELIPDQILPMIQQDQKLLSKFQNTNAKDVNGNDIGPIIDANGKLNNKVSADNYYKDWQKLSKQLLKGKDNQFKNFTINQVLKTVLRGDNIADPKQAPNHLVTVNGIFPMTDDYFDVVSAQSDLEFKPSKTIISTTNLSSYNPSSAEMLKKFTVVVEQKEEKFDVKKYIVDIDTIDPMQVMVNHLLTNYEFDLNASLLPGFKPKDLNSVEYNYVTIGKKTIKIPVEKGQKVANAILDESLVLVNDLLIESLTNNFVLDSLRQAELITDSEEALLSYGENILLENEYRPLELKQIYKNILEKIEDSPEKLFLAIDLLNNIEEEYERDYKKEYKNYHGKPKQRKERAARTKAREEMEKKGVVKKGDGKDIDHKNPLRSGGSKGLNNLRVRSRSANRSDNGHKKGEKQKKGSWK